MNAWIIDNPINLDEYCKKNGYVLDDLMLYWDGNGKFIDYRPEYGNYVPVFGKMEHASNLEISHIDDESPYGPKLTIGYAG